MSQKTEYFGKYILLEKLAMGGMAEVFLARAPGAGGIGKFVAIKRILPQYSDNQEFIDMFKDEAKIAINLSHGNIVSISEFGLENHQFFLVMDYVEGRNLRQILNKMKKARSKFSIDQIVYMIKEIAAGLDHAHRCLDGTTGKPLNITHRDMSPQNIMTSFEGELKIVDFGIAKAESQMETTRAGTLKGKFGYMSPEQAEGQPVDLRTDIFSLGIVLWELLANERLFIANNEINTLRKIRDCQVPSLRKINPNIHAELERISMKALARDRNLRYQTAAALHRDLNRFLNRQYPDFSHHDFSVFIKTIYADEILDLRKRLIQYSKMTTPGKSSQSASFSDDKTVRMDTAAVRGDNDESFAKSQIDFNQRSKTNVEPEAKEKDFANTKTATATYTDSDLQVTKSTYNTEAVHPENKTSILDARSLQAEMHRPIKVAKRNPYSLDDPQVENLREGSGRNYGSISKYSRSRIKKRSRKSSFGFSSLFLFLCAFVGSYMFLNMILEEQMAPINKEVMKGVEIVKVLLFGQGRSNKDLPDANPIQPVVTLDNNGGSQDLSSKEQSTTIAITSTPSGAEIYLDGKALNRTTPAIIKVPRIAPFDITLKKTDYVDYTSLRSIMATDLPNKTIVATLQKSSLGYLDIDAKPIPVKARVIIDGILITEAKTLPLTSYAVPAGKKITVTVEDPVRNLSASKTIIVREGKRSVVLLNLTRKSSTKRIPSGK